MSPAQKWTALVAIALVLGVGIVLAQGSSTSGGPGYGGMMGGGYGPGHGMGGPGYGGMMGGGMMGGSGMMQVLPSDARPLADDAVRSALQQAAGRVAAGGQVHDVMVFTNNVYAQVLDARGNAVAEILLDRYSGRVTPEPGPNMMWNTARGSAGWGAGAMGGAAGGFGSGASTAPLDEAAARQRANDFLAGYLPGATVLDAQTFPGYFTFDYGTDGADAGMLSVNAATGQVWPHTWHGAFVRDMP